MKNKASLLVVALVFVSQSALCQATTGTPIGGESASTGTSPIYLYISLVVAIIIAVMGWAFAYLAIKEWNRFQFTVEQRSKFISDLKARADASLELRDSFSIMRGAARILILPNKDDSEAGKHYCGVFRELCKARDKWSLSVSKYRSSDPSLQEIEGQMTSSLDPLLRSYEMLSTMRETPPSEQCVYLRKLECDSLSVEERLQQYSCRLSNRVYQEITGSTGRSVIIPFYESFSGKHVCIDRDRNLVVEVEIPSDPIPEKETGPTDGKQDN